MEGAARLRRITQPVLVVNGKADVMVPTINSFALFQQLPDARLVLDPDSGHGALFQYSDAFERGCGSLPLLILTPTSDSRHGSCPTK